MAENKIISRVRNKSYYVRIVISFIILCVIVVTTMSVAFSNIYKKALVESTTREYMDSLNRLNINIENILKQLDNMYKYMRLDKDVNFYLITRENDIIASFKAQNVAIQAKNLNKYIHSVYLYNMKSGSMISTGTALLDRNELDGLVAGSLSKSDASRKKKVTRFEVNEKNAGRKGLLSVKYEEFSSNDSLQSSIVINLEEETLENDTTAGFSGNTLLLDENGSILMKQVSQDGDSMPGAKELMDSFGGASKGSLILELQDEPYIITYAKSDLYHFYIVNSRPYSEITMAIKSRELLLYGLSMAFLLAFITISLFISSRVYSPIKKIVGAIKTKIQFTDHSVSGEVPLISDVIEQSLKKMNELTHKNDENKALRREGLLRSLIVMGEGGKDGQTLIEEELPDICFKNLYLALVVIDSYKMNDENNIKFIELFVSTAISEVLEKDFQCETVNMYHGEICILMNFKNNRPESQKTLLAALEEMKDFVNRITGTTITIGIGGAIDRASACTSAYSKAREMIKYRFILGTNRVIYEEYIKENFTKGLLYPTELKEQMILAIRHNDSEEFEKTLDQVVHLMSRYVYSDVIVILLKLVIDCVDEMNGIVSKIKRIELDYSELNNIFLDLSTLDHARNWLVELFSEFHSTRGRLDNLEDSRYLGIVNEAKKYIQENYADSSLSVERLAEVAGYSDKYFSKIFKEVSGSLPSEYIRLVRIERAKELLGNKNIKISEVYGKVGFVNSSHFFTSFKNEIGMTPSEYRKFNSMG